MIFKTATKKETKRIPSLPARATQGGFTLVETFVAITILMLAVVGPLSIAQKSLDAAIYSKDEVTAYYLAQDALEYVIQMRDTNTSNGNTANGTTGASGNWLYGIPSGCFSGGTCKIDTTQSYVLGGSGGLSTCSLISNTCALNYNTSTHLYGEQTGGSWGSSPFVRTITFTADSDHELTMEVSLTWRSGLFAAPETYTVYEHIFNWQ